MLMMVMGVATWMFPRPARDDTRYRPELAEAVYWVMTLDSAPGGGRDRWRPPERSACGGSSRWVGSASSPDRLFVLNMWWRVRIPPLPPADGALSPALIARFRRSRRL